MVGYRDAPASQKKQLCADGMHTVNNYCARQEEREGAVVHAAVVVACLEDDGGKMVEILITRRA